MRDLDRDSYLVLIRLTPIKNALQKDMWLSRKDKILMTTDRVIRDALSTDDAFTIHGDETCMIALAKKTREQATKTAHQISEQIIRGPFGDFGAAAFPLEPTVMAIPDLLTRVNQDDAGDLLQDIINNHGPTLPIPKDPKRDEAVWRKAQKAYRRRKLNELFKPERPAEISYEYQPVWWADDQAVERFRCVPVIKRSEVERLCAYDVLPANYTEAEIVDLDVASIENAVIDMKKAVDAGYDVSLSLPLHFETVGSSLGRTEIANSLSIVPPSFRQRIAFTLMGVPEGIPEARLGGIVNLLKPYSESRSIILDALPTNTPSVKVLLARVRATGMDTVGIVVPKDVATEDVRALCAIVPHISGHGLKLIGYGLTDSECVAQLLSAGFAGFAGRVFGGPFAQLPAPYILPANRLCDSHEKRTGTTNFYA